VLQNTALISGTYQNAVEYRFVESTGVVIANNLLDAAIQARDGATGAVTNNYLGAAASMFVNAAAGDLHLVATDAAVIGKVPTLQNALLDWDGDARPLARLSDYGADEFSAGSLPTAPVNMRIVRH
jgi:hypothetical protein